MCVCVCVCVHARVCVAMRVWMRVCVCMCMHARSVLCAPMDGMCRLRGSTHMLGLLQLRSKAEIACEGYHGYSCTRACVGYLGYRGTSARACTRNTRGRLCSLCEFKVLIFLRNPCTSISRVWWGVFPSIQEIVIPPMQQISRSENPQFPAFLLFSALLIHISRSIQCFQ